MILSMKTDFASMLRKAGLKATPARLSILAAFSKKHLPLSADDVTAALKGKKVDAVTVYRTLASLEKSSILKRVDLRKGSAHFEMADDHHHHIVCKGCGDIEDFELCNAEAVSRQALKESKRFSEIQEHSLELFGLCKSCAKS
jgi:Fur family ferric uptake transcriptional regulator